MTNPNDPAHPAEDRWHTDGTPEPQEFPGLTKREYFTAMAMQGLCATVVQAKDDEWDNETLAECAVRIATETIAALNAQTETP